MFYAKKIRAVVLPIFVIFFIFSFFFFSAPRTSYAIFGIADIVFDPANLVQNTINAVSSVHSIVKESVLDTIAWSVSKMIVQKMTAQTVNWINSGFKGNPAYVTDPGQFFLNVGDETASKFLSSTAFNQLCAPFKPQVRLALVKNYLSETSPGNYSCTISGIIDNYDNFINDFNEGGWDGWFAVTQNSQNNPYGAYATAKAELSTNIIRINGKYQQQLEYGKGFFSFEGCKAGTAFTQADIDYAKQITGSDSTSMKIGDCNPEDKETKTPGSVIEGQLNSILPKGAEGLIQADEINEIVGALMTQLIGKVVGGGGSLRGTTAPGSASSGRTFIDQFAPDSPETLATNETLKQQLINSVAPSLKSPLPTPPNAPFIYLNDLNPMTVLVGTDFVDPGAHAFDSKDGDITTDIIASGFVNIQAAGAYTLTYRVFNSSGIPANPVTRTVQVVSDPSAPVVSGMCGNADKDYDSSLETDFGSYAFCASGSPDVVPLFPAKGESTSWVCSGQNGGGDSPMCVARVF